MQRIFLIVIVCCYHTVHAADWYVDTVSTGTNNGTSWENAWQDFESIDYPSLAGGDTVFISGGNDTAFYDTQLDIEKGGVSDSLRIVFKVSGEPGHNGIAVCEKWIRLHYRSYVTIDGEVDKERHLWVRDTVSAGAHGVSVYSGRNLTVRYVDIYGPRDHGVGANAVAFCRISNCKIIRARGDGINKTGRYDIETDSLTAFGLVVIDSCYIDSCCDDGVQLGSVTMYDTYIKYNYGMGGCDPGYHPDGIQLGKHCHHQRIFNNTFVNTPQGVFIDNTQGHTYVYNNVFYDIPAELPSSHTNRAVSVNKSSTDTLLGPVLIANNVFYNQDWVTLYMPEPAYDSTDELIIENNVFLNYSRAVAGGYDFNPFISNSNLFYTDEPYVSVPDSGMKTDPQLVDYKGFDFHPTATSPVRNSGTNLSRFFTADREGNPRPADGAWDIGAYQYDDMSVRRPISGSPCPRLLPVLLNPWQPESGYEIIGMTGKRTDWQNARNGIYLVRKSVDGPFRKVLVKR